MKVPLLQITAIGEFSPWARQFFTEFEEKEIIQVSWESSVDNFCRSALPGSKPAVVFIENSPESKKTIEKLCTCGKAIYLGWLAKSFSAQDFSFGMESRVYCMIESIRMDEKKIIGELKKLAALVDSDGQFQQILRAMKAILLQTEAEFPEIPMVAELRTAVKKLESYGLNNELNHLNLQQTSAGAESLFHKSQTLGESLIIVSELGRTGTLWVKGKTSDQEGKIEFLQGRVIEAVSGSCEGIKAIYRMFLWDQPKFLFNRKDPREANIAKNLDMDLFQVVRKGNSIKDRFERIRKDIPPAGLKLEVTPAAMSKDVALAPNEFLTLSSVIEHGVVSHVVDFNPMPDIDIYESLISLKRNQMLRKSA